MIKFLIVFSLLCLTSAQVQIQVGGPNGENEFVPQNITITAGTTVTWVWQSGSHSVVSGIFYDGSCLQNESPLFTNVESSPFSYNYTFLAPDVYAYYCSVHCTSGMIGTITVNGNPPPTTAATTSSASTLGPIILLGASVLAMVL